MNNKAVLEEIMIGDNSPFITKIELDMTAKRIIETYNRSDNQPDGRSNIDNHCPHCHVRMVRLGVCFSCPLCGFGSCG
jgi:hypothetical protein